MAQALVWHSWEVMTLEQIADALGITQEECQAYLDKMKVKPTHQTAFDGLLVGYGKRIAEQVITLYQMTHQR